VAPRPGASHLPTVPSPSPLLPNKLQALWESRAGDALRRVGLRSVRTTILTLAMLATLIPALATGCISYRQNRRAIEEKLVQQLDVASKHSARQVGLWFRERVNDMQVYRGSPVVMDQLERGGGESRRLRDYLVSVNDRTPEISELMVFTRDLRPVAFTGQTAGRPNFEGDWLRKFREGEDYVFGDPQSSPGDSVTTIDVAIPIRSGTDRFLGVLVARLDLERLRASLEEFVPGPESRLLVFRSDGRSVVHFGGTGDSLTGPLQRRLEGDTTGSTTYTAPDGIEVVGRLNVVTGGEWMTVAAIPVKTAFADIRSLRNKTILLTLVLLLGVGSLAYGLGLLVVLPLERLSKAADKVAGGDLDVEVPVAGGGEVAQLTGVFNDMVMKLREGRHALELLSVTDGLTGLANRRRLDAELAREILSHDRHHRSFSVLMLDVDKFKVLNDTHGHPSGDAVLRQLAKILGDCTRRGDTVGRFGGEEFMLLLPETPAAGALHLAENLRATVEETMFRIEGGKEVRATVSIGMARFPDHGKSAEALIAAADGALYRSKQSGRNRITSAD
jgi:diguanylate cyclase (GGDEF)-like protein